MKSFATFFNTSGSLFLFPLAVFIFSFIAARLTHDWAAIAYAVWIVISLFALVLSGLLLLANNYFLRWKLNWWKNILLSVALFVLTALLLVLLLRLAA